MLSRNTCNACSSFRPSDLAKTSPSASAARFSPRTRFVISFIFAPLPHGPVWMMCFANRRKSSWHFSNAAREKCQELFRLFAKHIIHTGPCGSGAKMKLITNLVLGLNRAALAEGLVFARSLGLNDEQALQVLRDSMAYSRIMDAKGEKMVQEDFEPHAKLSQHLKDVRLMIEAAAKTNTKLPLSETHRDILVFGEQNGLGQLDNSAIIRAIELLKNLRPY